MIYKQKIQAVMLLDITNEINRLSNNNTNEIDNTSTIEITLSVNDTFED